MIIELKLNPYDIITSTRNVEQLVLSYVDKYPNIRWVNNKNYIPKNIKLQNKIISNFKGYYNKDLLITSLTKLTSEEQIELFTKKDKYQLHFDIILPRKSCDLMDCWWDFFKEYYPEQLI